MDQPEQPARDEFAPRGAEAVLHDVKNLLTTIASLTVRARSASLDAGMEPEEDCPALLGQLGRAVGEAMQLARAPGLGAFQARFGIADYLLAHAPALGALLGGEERLRIRIDASAVSSTVHMDATDLLRILVNLIRNAEESGALDRDVDLELETVELVAPLVSCPRDLPPRKYGVLRISDRGHGIEEELVEYLLQPGKSKKGPGRGKGLAVVTQLLEEADGGLRVEAREGGGSVFEVYVPLES